MSESDLSCFDFVTPGGNRHLKLEEGARLIQSMGLGQLQATQLPLHQVMGRVLAEDVIAPFNVPRQVNAAMDGFALKGDELATSRDWKIVGQSFAGHAFTQPVEAGCAVQITTGAPMPSGTDTVVMKELCRVESDQLHIDQALAVRPGSNVRQAGEDMAEGSLILSRGQRLGPVEVGMLASLGFAQIKIHVPLKVAVFSTGDEVRAPGDALADSSLYDTNRFTLMSVLKGLECDVSDLGILPDDEQVIEEALRSAAQQHRLVLTSGGVSVGEADFVKQALNRLGQTSFWQLAIRPGRPIAFGDLGLNQEGETCLFAGLPGNPVAVMVTFCVLLQPLIRKLQGETEWVGLTWMARSTETMKSRTGRSDFHRGIFTITENGELEVRTTGHQGSGILTSMHEANCLIRIEEDRDRIEVGDRVRIYPFSRWLPGYPLV
ncbi:MAG: gephyrin-like molybdotransferase Glp [Nitrincola lacisaponensis]|uniref:molybdopterin molybdotransferase MoeA n=1 Tax=Nitrincola lacisaponensis TaxID=267850 RepID=UPI00391D6041